MEDTRFDRLTRRIATRRTFLGSLAIGLVPVLRPPSVAAAPSVSVTPSPVPGGKGFTLKVAGFVPREMVRFRYYFLTDAYGEGQPTENGVPYRDFASKRVDADGKATLTISAADAFGLSERGSHRLRARGASGRTAETTLTFRPGVTFPGGQMIWEGTTQAQLIAWPPNKSFKIRLYATTNASSSFSVIAQGTTDDSGLATVNTTWTGAALGKHLVKAVGSGGAPVGTTIVKVVCGPNKKPNGSGGCCGTAGLSCFAGSTCCSGVCDPATSTCPACALSGTTCNQELPCCDPSQVCSSNVCQD